MRDFILVIHTTVRAESMDDASEVADKISDAAERAGGHDTMTEIFESGETAPSSGAVHGP